MKLLCNYYIRNYGSVLQSYATFITLKSIDNNVEVIRYKNRSSFKAKLEIALRIRLKYLMNIKMVKNKLRKVFKGDHDYIDILTRRGEKFDQFNALFLDFTNEFGSIEDVCKSLEKDKYIIIGSDQLWGPEDIICDYHTLNWVPEGVSKIAYATSFGVSELPCYLKERTKVFLNKMDMISCRETAGVEIIKNLLGQSVPQVCDPTLLLSRKKWDEIASERKIVDEPYIFVFFIGDNPIQRKRVATLRGATGYKIVSIQHLDQYIPSDEHFADITVNDASPQEFISLIKQAEYVVTDSFHATIFSVIYEKRFLTFNRYESNSSGSRNSRIDSICNKLGLNERRCNPDDDIYEKINNDIDFKKVNHILNVWRKESINYLTKALEVK